MANTPTNDLIVSKLSQRYTGSTFADLWVQWSAEFGTQAYMVGDALYDHYGGPEIELADRANRFWAAWNPVVGG